MSEVHCRERTFLAGDSFEVDCPAVQKDIAVAVELYDSPQFSLAGAYLYYGPVLGHGTEEAENRRSEHGVVFRHQYELHLGLVFVFSAVVGDCRGAARQPV